MTTTTSAVPLDSAAGPSSTRLPESRLATHPGAARSSRPTDTHPSRTGRPMPRASAPPWALVVAGTAIAYAVLGWLGMLLAISPSPASPMYPAAGLALAATLVFGLPAAIGTALGSVAVNLGHATSLGPIGPSTVAAAAAIGAGATLQALAARALLRQVFRVAPGLTEPRDVLRFMAVGAGCCAISASVAHAALVATGAIPPSGLAVSWLTWLVGDALGVLIGAPIALTLIGQPRSDWAPRRVNVGLPLMVATAVTALAIVLVQSWEREQAAQQTEAAARQVRSALEVRARDAQHALEAVRGAIAVTGGVDRALFATLAAPWLAADMPVSAIAWFVPVPPGQAAALEAAVRAEGRPEFASYRVFNLPDPGQSTAAPIGPGEEVLAMRFVEPLAGQQEALGVNLLSIGAAREAARSTIANGRAATSDPFVLNPGTSGSGTVVAVHGAVRVPDGSGAGALRGVVSVVLRLDDLVLPALSAAPAGTVLCLFDADAPEPVRRLWGTPGCEAAGPHDEPLQRSTVSVAGQVWQVAVRRDASAPEGLGPTNVWMFALLGLLATAMFGALMLIVTGRTRRIEAAVRARTAQLEAQARERARAESALRESEQRFRNILNTVPIGVVYTDLSGQIRQANPKFCELLGYSPDELAQRRAQDLTDEQDLNQEMELSVRLVRGELPGYRLNKRYIARDGRRVWVRSVVSTLRDENGQPRRIVGVAEDITEQLRLAEAERARETAEAANRAKSDFLSRMSHELRTPLNAMLGFAQLLELDQRSPLSDAQRPWVSQIQQAGWHLLEMINDVLDLSRIESGTLRLQLEPIDIREQVDASAALIERDALRRGLTLSTHIDPAAARVVGDATRVKQILTNLLTNAVKYNRDGGRIELTTRLAADGHRVEIDVSDTGLGMTDEQLAHLFEPFNRLGRERTSTEGTGIGLVISRRLAELMDGLLTARSRSGEGSRFVLSLPRAPVADTAAEPEPRADDPELAYHQRVVHYVEDNETNIEVMRGILAQRPQVRLEVSTTVAQGLARLARQRVDLILLDMHLPDGTGLDVLAALRADPALRSVPVVVVSADAMASQVDAALAAGASAYLTKPVSVSELLRVVDQRLDEADTAFG
ncbi:MAG: PAS domain S-box protein [Ideonella sp.]|nr:PAS domain S-box protein [Ideonella sp.]